MLGGRLGPLRERQFRLLWLGRVSSFAGDGVKPVALAFGVLSVTHRATDLGLVLAVYTIFQVAATPVGGVYADRLPRRVVMLCCDGTRAIVEAFAATMLITHQMTLPLFFVTTAIFGTASGVFRPASTGLVPQTVSRGQLRQANALLGMSQAGANVLGPAVSGALVAAVGAGWVFAIDAASFTLSGWFLLRLRLPPHERPPRSHFLTDLAHGLHEVRTRAWVWTPMIAFAVTNFCFGAFVVLGPAVARDRLGGAEAWGLISAGGAVGGVVGGATAFRLGPRRPLVAGFLAWTLCSLPLFALAPPLAAAVIAGGFAVGMAGIAFGTALWETTLQARIPSDVLSRVSSYEWLMSYAFVPIGFVTFPLIAAAIGTTTTLVAAGGVLAATNLLVALTRPVHDVATSPPEQRPATVPRVSKAA